MTDHTEGFSRVKKFFFVCAEEILKLLMNKLFPQQKHSADEVKENFVEKTLKKFNKIFNFERNLNFNGYGRK